MTAGRSTEGLTAAQAAAVIGVSVSAVHALVNTGTLPKAVHRQVAGLEVADVERVALDRVGRGSQGHPYWATAREAAGILGVSRAWVDRLAREDRLPYVEHRGRRLYRRAQLQVIANGRRQGLLDIQVLSTNT